MAPIEVKEAAKRATPKLADGLFVLEAFLEMELKMMHLERFRLAVQKRPKTFEKLIAYRRQIFEAPDPSAKPLGSGSGIRTAMDLEQVDLEPMKAIHPSKRCVLFGRSRVICL
ncbi:unnamed protein product [Durusdinium trenchii]|uniref:Uncharacterized protein n=1 Tax=Durusdinium trenchii TaxID=1381693 RepID=A0ABP0QV18_9DINO